MTRRRKRFRLPFLGVLRVGFIVAMLGFVTIPLIWMVATSIKRPNEISTTQPILIPADATLDNYRAALGFPTDRQDGSITLASRRAPRSFANSVIVATSTTIVVMALATPAAYAIARYRPRGRRAVSQNILFARVLPAGAIAIPLFVQFTALRLIDTPLVLILLYTGAILPFAVWTLVSFISELPRDIEEAAWVDGASTMQSLRHVVSPIIAPAVVATGVISYIFAFNEYFFALVFTRIEWLTFPVQTASLIGTGGIAWGPITAAGVIGLLPPLITLIVAQRFLVRGLSLGAVK